MPAPPKKLFLVDAMAHIHRAFVAPMPQRLTGPGGVPTNVPFLFGNILRRLLKDYQPDYIGIVFDPPGATFRDKLFEKYKAQRQPMPEEMRVQLPFVRRLCEAMRMPMLEVKGYEADDVIGTMAVKAGKHNLEVLIVSNDKDMMQLVGKSVRTLRTGSGGAKGDIIVDEKKVEELLGVPPEKVVDYMALLGDTIDNIPGAKGIGEKGAAELIRKYGSVESALDHAAEVSNKRYREALQQQREQVLMSKQLATIATDAPIDVKPQELELCPPNAAALAELYRELGFNSLLKELGSEAVARSAPASSESAAKADYRQCASVAEFRKYVTELPRKEPLAIWLNLETGERADYLQRLVPVLHEQVSEQKLDGVYETIDLPLAPVLADIERTGVRVDFQELGKMSQAMEKEIRRLEKEIWQLAGLEFNVNSPTQLAEILFDKLNLQPNARRGKAKARSTAADILEELAAQHPLPGKIIEYREFAKLKSTYVDALPKLIHPETGRLHTSFSQTGTATGRLSSSDPNLQNIPIRSELGREIRAAFVAEKGKVLLSADYSQIELRIMAHFSADPVLVEAFRNGEDIHARTAQEVFGVGPLGQTAEHRRAAKAINFGIIYGLSPFGLAQQLCIEQKEAAQFINDYFARYRGVTEYMDNVLAETRKTGVAKTMFGRIRPIPEITSPQVQLRNFAERTALNSPLQGTAADLIKLAMINIDRRLTEEELEAQMILQVHDELLFESPAKESARLRKLVKEEMEGVHQLAVPIVVEIGVGPNWRDLD